ncbi:hypothetical protein Tco_0061075, partial [Tanacetum coccineum]
ATTLPFVTSSVTPTLEREGGDHTDSVSGPNLRTIPPAVRFVISSDLSHHSGTHAVDVELSSLIRSTVPDPLVMTAAVTTTIVVETSLVSVPKVKVQPVNPVLFGDSISTSGHDVTGPSSLAHPDLSADSFYTVQGLNPETLHRVYVPKWIVTNESVLDDPYVCRSLTDQLAPSVLFAQLRTIEYDQLFAEYNMAVAHQTCLGAEAAEATRVNELNDLKGRNIALEGKVAALEATATSKYAELASSSS